MGPGGIRWVEGGRQLVPGCSSVLRHHCRQCRSQSGQRCDCSHQGHQGHRSQRAAVEGIRHRHHPSVAMWGSACCGWWVHAGEGQRSRAAVVVVRPVEGIGYCCCVEPFVLILCFGRAKKWTGVLLG